ncbi:MULTISPECIES: GIY-YIG nuclease family protein [unclassified Sphingobium]|uniref:GIY-YIG nuclease family protein n=1 Tax=unclassified Sphingobium TaxID=2611147 RepID=UPI002225ABA5|nr:MULTISPECIES: GIY-YIG nuclease family protein [unclassified Sphingobium]
MGGDETTKRGFLYLMASKPNGTLYLGVTSDLVARCHQHREGHVEGFSKRYGCRLLVWYAVYDDLQEARLRELQMKKWKRAWKVRLIRENNPGWRDLWSVIAT